MEIERFEALESHVIRLLHAFARVKEENEQLHQSVKQLQGTLHIQQRELEELQTEREELVHLRTIMHTFQQERDVIRQKLEQMVATIEWLEERARVKDGAEM